MLPLAGMVGPSGKVIAVDIQEIMLEKVKKRAHRAGMDDRIECRLVTGTSHSLTGTAGKADLAVALHVVHEVPDQTLFFGELFQALKTGGKLLFHEPSNHVSEGEFKKSVSIAEFTGFKIVSMESLGGSRRAVFRKK